MTDQLPKNIKYNIQKIYIGFPERTSRMILIIVLILLYISEKCKKDQGLIKYLILIPFGSGMGCDNNVVTVN